ncbi:MAG: T9SS type A sorting domain-containing protein [Ignavibacteriae bacterium]|nr:T9SS type A sorting domain-containing protein [Ignavibacteriota bacterium]
MKKLYSLLAAVLVVSTMLISSAKAGETDVKKLPSLLGANNAGTEFYFSFPPCYEEESAGFMNSCRVFVASGAKQLITLEIPGKAVKMTKICKANDVVEFVLGTGAAQPFIKAGRVAAPPEQVYQGAAVHITSAAPIVVYGVTRYNYTSDGFLAVPVSALGKEYIVSAYPQYTAVGSGYQLVSETTISAAYDDTQVFFEMGGTLQSETSGGLKPGKSTSFTLVNKGDVLCFSSNGDLQDISGSRVLATKPVAVVSGNQCANVPAGVYACDYMSEMDLPTFTWGKEYHVTPFYGRKKNPVIRIYAKEKNTKVFRDGQEWLVIPRASRKLDDGYVERRSFDGDPKAVVISADKPIYVEEYNPGQSDDNISSDPFMLVLSPFEQYQKEIVWCTPGALTSNNNFKSHYVNLIYQLTPDGVIPDDIEFAISVNGKFEWKRVSARFGGSPGYLFSTPINDQKYACKQLILPGDNTYRLRAKTPFAAYAYGFSNYDSYGMPTSVALGNLELKDTVKPRPKWTVKCDGSVDDGMVTDYPDDDASRSNLGLIYMDLDSSYNYEFNYDTKHELIVGTTRTTDWNLKVIDPSKDARAFLVFVDRASNDSIIVIEYKAFNLTMEPTDYLNYGVMKRDSIQTLNIKMTNTGPTPLNVTQLKLKSGNQGFTIDKSITLPFVLAPGDSKVVPISFTNIPDGLYDDQIGVGNECVFFYKTKLTAEIASPEIMVDDHDYGTRSKGTRTIWSQMRVQNIGKVDLIVYGDDHATAITGPQFEPMTWAPPYPYPVKIAPGQSISFQVDFVPPTVGTFTSTITFSSDAKKSDSVSILKGIAQEPGLIATPYDWNRKRINPTAPYPSTIELQNDGSQAVTIQSATGSDPNFNVDLNLFTNLTIQPGVANKMTFPVEFNPTATGDHTMTINFITTTPGVSASSKLDGTGIIGRLKTQDINFDTTVVGTLKQNTRQLRIECEKWTYEDSVTIKDLLVSTGSINADLTAYSVDGYRFDKQTFGLPNKVMHAGDIIIVDVCEFLAPTQGVHTAALTTSSDAEAEVTSNWTGFGRVDFVPVRNILAVGGNVVDICVGTTGTINASIVNTGNQAFLIDKLELDANPQFTITSPATPTVQFPLLPGVPVPVTISYTPTASGSTTIKLHIYSSDLGRDTAVDITGIAVDYTSTATTGSNPSADIGSKVFIPITLKDPISQNANVTNLKVTVEYDGRLLAPSLPEFIAGAAAAGFTVQNPVETKGKNGKVEFNLATTGQPLTTPGEIVKMYFYTFLPTATDNTTITTTITTNSACAKITTEPGLVKLNPTCAFVIRKVDSKNVMYSMTPISPNPVGATGAEVEFSIGLKGATELSIYNNSGAKVGTVATGTLEAGNYSVKVPVDGLSSGTYMLRLSSGPYKQEQQLVIVK